MAIGTGLLAVGALLWWKKRRSLPKDTPVVGNFDSQRYLGKWYEIGRLDYRFEKNLDHVTAEYSLNDDGSIKVLNRGYDAKKDKWEEAEGKAKFVHSPREGMLKVSFFGPFYAGYNVIAIDPEYKYALVAGEKLSYLWLLSRETTMPEDIKQEYLRIAATIGFDISKLIWTNQEF